MSKSTVFQRYFLPGFVFQSLVIAGGYGTGRELVEFFLSYGPLGGLLGMLLVSTVIWSLVCASTFEFARVFRCFEYRHFFRELLGRYWVLFEICYLVILLIVLAVIASASGSTLEQLFGLPYILGVIFLLFFVGLLVFLGTGVIEKFLAGWSFLLYAVYIAFCVASVWSFGDQIAEAWEQAVVLPGWFVGGVAYAGYNLGIVPAALFVVPHFESRRDAVVAGLLAGPIAILPGVFFFVSVSGFYPGIIEQTVPIDFLLEALGSHAFRLLFWFVLFGTLIETGTGLIHSINERLSGAFRDANRNMPVYARPLVSTGLLVLGAVISQFGLVGLIAQGYGTVTWGFIVIYVIPVLTLGWWKIRRRSAGIPS